ncbi:hypothetical protein A1QQ_10020 [Vibrio ordalii FF-167]|nr:hypothetical protein A1QQ_10020 [Vibrio ordalii FF-167]
MNNYVITPELSDYVRLLQSANTYVELMVVAINYALENSGQPRIVSQGDLDEFIKLFSLDM